MAPPPDRDDPDELTPRRPTAAERRRHEQAHPHGVPVVRHPDDPTPPLDEPLPFNWGVMPGRADAEELGRAGRDPSTPVAPAELSAIIRQLRASLREEFARLRVPMPGDIEDQVAAVDTRLAALEIDFAPHRRFGKWVAGFAGAALVAVGLFLYHRGASEQLINDRLQQLERFEERIERQHEPSQQTGPRP